MEQDARCFDHRKLARFAAAVLGKAGLPAGEAAKAAEMIVAADLRGIDTHGVAHLGPFYVTRLQKGQINTRPSLRVESHAAATAVMDGDNGMGFLVGQAAMTEAMRRADEVGVGLVAVRNSTHFGAASLYSLMAAKRGMIGISLSSTGPIVVPPGSTKRGVGTNPISIAVPAGSEGPFVLDMSTSVVPGGRISDALRRGQPIPLGWAVDNRGAPTTDPAAVFKGGGGLVPLGGEPRFGAYKGFGLGVTVEVFCSILSGAVASLLMAVDPASAGNRCDHFFGAIKVAGFGNPDAFVSSMQDMRKAYHGLPMAKEGDGLLLAGEVENAIEAKRLREGIPLHEKVVESLEQLARDLGVPFDL
jgi:L-2-hydroxycarboxylate dehydrogenase (NAD+)